MFGSISNGYGEIVFLFSTTASLRPIGAVARWLQFALGQIAHAGPTGVADGSVKSSPVAQ